MAGESRIACKSGGSTEILLEQTFPCSGGGTPPNPLHQRKDHLTALTWNEVTHKEVVLQGRFPSHFMAVGENVSFLVLILQLLGHRGRKEQTKSRQECMSAY